MVRLARVKPVLEIVGEGSVSPVAGERERWQITALGKLLLLFGKCLLLSEQLKFRQILVQSGESRHVRQLHVSLRYGNVLVGRIVDNVFQHVVLLCEHSLGVVVLHAEILQIHVHTLHVHAQSHVVVVESLCDIAQFFKSLDVVLDYANLLLGVLRQIIHLAYLHNQVFLGFGIR